MAAPVLQPIRTENMPVLTPNTGDMLSKMMGKVKIRDKEGPDPLRVLEPGRKKLSSLEAQRVLAVVEDTIRRAEISTILPYVVENLNRFSIILGSDLTRVLQEHDKLQSDYQKAFSQLLLDKKRLLTLEERLAAQLERIESETDFFYRGRTAEDVLKNIPLSQMETVTEEEVVEAKEKVSKEIKTTTLLEAKLRDSLRTVLRLFAKNPTALDSLRNEKKERSHETNELIFQMNALKSSLFERLLRTPNELKERNDYVRLMTEKERKSSVFAKKLEVQLAAAVEDKENEISKRNDVIRKIRGDIFHIENKSQENNDRIMNDALKDSNAELKNCEGRKAKLQQEIMELKKKLETNLNNHRDSELALRKKKYKVETEVENWIQKYDNDMGDRQDEFDHLDTIYTEEKKQLNELEERFRTMEKEYKEIVEARRIAQEKAEEAYRELQAKIKAANLIQSFWRAFRARKQLKNKKKKGKKGKKGKKRR